MARTKLPYILTVDDRRSLKRDGIKRPGRLLKQHLKDIPVVKEEAVVLTARIAKSSMRRFQWAVGNQPQHKKRGPSSPLGPAIEEAMLLWMAYQALDAEVLSISCTKQSFMRHKDVLADFKRRRRRVKSESDSYLTQITDQGSVVHLDIMLPPARSARSRLKRLDYLQKIFAAADLTVWVVGCFPVDWELERTRGRPKP